MNHSKYNIVVTRLFSRNIDGVTESSHPLIEQYHLTSYVFNTFRDWSRVIELYSLEHDYTTRRHYERSFTKRRYEIAEVIELPTGESVCILKTHYLRFIQKKWRKILDMRKLRLKKYKQLNILVKRERIGY
jgi:hypothetical protein